MQIGNVKVGYLSHTDDKIVKLWAEPSSNLPTLRDGTLQSFEDIFRWAAKKGAWHTDSEKYTSKTGGCVFEEEEDLFVDMWRHVWVHAVEKWDAEKAESLRRDPLDPNHSKAFFRWVMYLLGHYLTDVKRIHMTQKEKSRRATEVLEAPVTDEPWDAAWGEGVLEEKSNLDDKGFDEVEKLVEVLQDEEWLNNALTSIRDDRVKAFVAVLVKYYNKESTGDLHSRLRRVSHTTFPRMKQIVAEDPDVLSLVRDGMKRMKDGPKKPPRKPRTPRAVAPPVPEMVSCGQ